MSAHNIVMAAAGGGADKLYADDVFSAYTRTGTGASATVTTGIDLAAKGGLIWTKGRSGATDHKLTDTARGVTNALTSNTTSGQVTDATGITAISATGHTVGANATYNTNGATYVDWVFAKAPKFFDVVTYTGNNVAGRQIPHSLGVAPGMVIVKCVSSGANWRVYHRGMTSAAYAMSLNTTAAQGIDNSAWNSTVPTDTVFTLGGDLAVNSTPDTYVAYLFAHDSSADGIVQCGSFTTDGSGNATVNLGWEPQYLLVKTSGVAGQWEIFDQSRGWNLSGDDRSLLANSSNAEGSASRGNPTATGFYYAQGASLGFIYLAIRRPNKPPTTGTQVYNAIARTGTGAAATVTGVGFAPDLAFISNRNTFDPGRFTLDRLRGGSQYLRSSSTAAEAEQIASGVTLGYGMDGVALGPDTYGTFNYSGQPYINHFFKRAPGVMDIVCYTGTGGGGALPITHGLGSVPELIIVKNRGQGGQPWCVFSNAIAITKYLQLNASGAAITDSVWGDTAPTSTVFYTTGTTSVNAASNTYVAYLFAAKTGISSCFSYTGNGSTQTIDCGFTTGARFVMIKATSTTGDWLVGDSTRGLVAGNDPRLSLNTTAAEVTTEDWLDPHSSGFIVNQVAGSSANASGVNYIVLAFA